jgi:hypothetical protein
MQEEIVKSGWGMVKNEERRSKREEGGQRRL